MKISKGKIMIKRKNQKISKKKSLKTAKYVYKKKMRERERKRFFFFLFFLLEQCFSSFTHINQLSLTFYGSVINHSIYGFHVYVYAYRSPSMHLYFSHRMYNSGERNTHQTTEEKKTKQKQRTEHVPYITQPWLAANSR